MKTINPYIFLRNFKSNWFNSIVKTLGLAIAFVSAYFLFIFVSHEMSYDKNFEGHNNIFRIARNWQESKSFTTSTPVPLLKSMQANFSEIVTGTRLNEINDVNIKIDDNNYHIDQILAVDSSFLNTFNMQLVIGEEKKALAQSGNVIIDESTSKKYFGAENPIGKSIIFEGDYFDETNSVYTIAGVFKDFPSTCHLKSNFLLPFHSFGLASHTNHTNHAITTYLKLQNANDAKNINSAFPGFMKIFYGSGYYEYARSEYLLQPITDIHGDRIVEYSGYESPPGNNTNLFVFPMLAFLIMLIASINFVNLTIAEGKFKSINFGVNKLSGAGRFYFFQKFMSESFYFHIVAAIIAIVAFLALFPAFQQLMNRTIDIQIYFTTKYIFSLATITIVLSIAIGIIPSIFFSTKKTITYLKGNCSGINKSNPFSAIPQVIQFSICIMLFAGSIIVFKQLRFAQQEESKGFDKENVLAIKNPRHLFDQRSVFKEELKKIPGVSNVSLCNDIPGNGYFSHWGHPVDMAEVDLHVVPFYGDHDYVNTLNLKMTEGRYFHDDYGDDYNSLILNETAVKIMGWDNDPIGKRYRFNNTYNVIGVFKDIHFESVHNPILPQAILLANPDYASYVLVKISNANVLNTLEKIQKVWHTMVPDNAMQYSFLNDEYNFWYTTERKTALLSLILSAIAIFLSSLGLLGMVLHSIHRKIKEIGIRKVNGARVYEIMGMLNAAYIKWIIISFIVATPLVQIVMQKWLDNFSYKTQISWWVFASSLALTLLVALVSVNWQTWRAARRNPVEALRYE